MKHEFNISVTAGVYDFSIDPKSFVFVMQSGKEKLWQSPTNLMSVSLISTSFKFLSITELRVTYLLSSSN